MITDKFISFLNFLRLLHLQLLNVNDRSLRFNCFMLNVVDLLGKDHEINFVLLIFFSSDLLLDPWKNACRDCCVPEEIN